jgi:hypothetical protein
MRLENIGISARITMTFHSQCFQAPSVDINLWLQNVGQFQKGTGEETTRNLLSDSGSVRQDE